MSEDKDKTAKPNAPDKGNESKQVSVADTKAGSDSSSKESKPDPAKPSEKEARSKQSTAHPAHRKRKSSSHKTSSWGMIVFVLLGLIAAAAWYGHSEFNKTQKTFTDIQQSQSALTEQNREFEVRLLARMEAMQTQQQELTDYIQVLRDKNQHLRKDWLLMEAEYLIQLANYRLLFERDINTAIAALESADVRLRDTGDPGILSVRKVIAEAVQALRQVPQADLAGLSLTLSAINKDIDKLPLNTPDPKSKQHEQQSEAEQKTKHVKSWQELPAAIWSDLKGLVEIRDHEAPIQPLLSPEERFFLIENLRLQIEQARLAMLSGQAKVYQERLTTAISWIDQHFDKQSKMTASTLETLKQLQHESIAPPLPDITDTYQALRNYRLGKEPVSEPSETKPAVTRPNATQTAPQPAQATTAAEEKQLEQKPIAPESTDQDNPAAVEVH